MKKTTLILSVVIASGLFAGSALAHEGHDHSKGKKLMDVMTKSVDKMKLMNITTHADADFGMMMTQHHKGAVEMAKLQIKGGKDATIKKMAENIIKKQEKEIKELSALTEKLSKNHNLPHKAGFDKQLLATMKMAKMDLGEDMDKNFVTMMIMHHKQGIEMAKLELKNGVDAEMKKMAQKIIDDQTKELKEMQAWLDKNK